MLPTRLGRSEHLPSSFLLQSAFEGIHWFVALSSGFREGWIPGMVERVEFNDELRPGESVQIEIRPSSEEDFFSATEPFTVTGRVGTRAILDVRGATGGKIPLSELLDPHDLQTLTAEIAAPEVRAAAGIRILPA